MPTVGNIFISANTSSENIYLQREAHRLTVLYAPVRAGMGKYVISIKINPGLHSNTQRLKKNRSCENDDNSFTFHEKPREDKEP